MEIILLISENKKIIGNLSEIKLKNHNIAYLTDIEYFNHYLEEYMPKYVILSEEIKNYENIAEFVNHYTDIKLIITGTDIKRNNNLKNIYLGEINKLEDLERILRTIDNLDIEVKEGKENNYKFLKQQVISFYSIQGGVGKTSLVFNFAWYLKEIIDGKILIIDLNFCEGPSDLTINLDLNLSTNLSVFIEKINQGKDFFNESIVDLDKDRVDILQPPLSIYQSDKFNIDMLNSIIYSARNEYNIIIADVPFRYDNISLEMLNLSTASILVLSPDIKLAPRVNSFQKFLPSNQRKGILFNKVYDCEIRCMDEYKSILKIPVCDQISFIPEKDKRLIVNDGGYFNILDLQSKMSNLGDFIF